MLFKLWYLNSNFALTLGYLNPSLNNPAQEIKFLLAETGIQPIFASEFGNLGFVICNLVQGIRNPANDWNSESKFHWQKKIRIQYLESGIHNPRMPWIPLHRAIGVSVLVSFGTGLSKKHHHNLQPRIFRRTLIPDGHTTYKLVNNLGNTGFVQILGYKIRDLFQTQGYQIVD